MLSVFVVLLALGDRSGAVDPLLILLLPTLMLFSLVSSPPSAVVIAGMVLFNSVLFGVLIAIAYRAFAPARDKARSLCRGCRYDLRGIMEDTTRCPECGRELTEEELRKLDEAGEE
ncbi:MAG: hypothetical protein ACF8NJ_04890 [Phycisphaerales bacterium JB038]